MSSVTRIIPRLQLGRYFADLRAYADLMVFLAGRDLAVRYKQTAAGILWAILVPLLTVVALSFVFGRVAKLEGSSLLMVYAGMIPWQFFSNGLSNGGLTLLNNNSLITKIYFPRLILPLASLGVAFVDLALNVVLVLIIAAFMGVAFTWNLLALPLWILMAFLVTLGPILIVAAALVRYRDLRFLIPFAIQFGLFVTPVGYSSAVVPAGLKHFFDLNPLVGVIEGMRWSLLNVGAFPAAALTTSLFVSALLIFVGGVIFIRTEATMADEI